MTVASTARRVQFTVGSSGQQGPYAFAFKVLDQADLAVYVGSTTASTLKTLTTHYTVSLSADGTGTITFASGQYPTEAQLVTIIGDKAYARTTDFTAGGDIRAATLNSDGDAQAIFAQQLDENLTRAIQVPIFGNRDYTSDGPLQWPYDSTSNNASKLVAYNSAGNALELTDKAVSAATVSASDVAVTSAKAAGTATASVTLSGAGALAFALGIPVGQTGMMGGISMQYSTTTADADPGAGFIRFNHATLSSATIMYVDDSDGTTDITAWVQSWDDSNSPNRGFITVAGNPNTSSPLAIFKCNGVVTDASGYSKIPVAYVAGSTSISNNAEVSVSFAPSGDGDYAGLDYIFSTTTTDSDPGAGTVRLNHGTLGSVTAIFVDDADANTANVEDYLLSWDDSTNLSDRGLIRITKKIAPANYALYKISGASTDASGYVKFAVTHLDSNGSISNADTVAIEFSATGNIGIPTGLNLTYSTTTTDSDPGAGVIRFNNATLASASLAYVDDADSAGANIEAYVLSWDDSTNTALRGTITLVKRDSPSVFAIWNITGASVDGSGYSKLALTYVAGTGSFANNDAVVLSFVRTGNAGADASNVFKTIAVSGQSDIVADSATDTLTLANGSGIAITTNAGTDTITIATTGGTTLSGSTNNTVATVTGANAIQGEANLTFSGTQLAVPDGAVATPSITNTGDLNSGVYFPAADTVGVVTGGTEQFRFGSNPLPGRNLVINGAMNVAQRGTSVTGAGAASGTLVQDRFIHMNDVGTGRYTVTQTGDASPDAQDGPVGFANCLKIDCTTADTSLASGVLQRIETRLEAQNLQHLAFGNAAAKTLTLSFYVKCTSTGTMSVLLQQQDGNRSWHKNYTIDATDTWERKTLVYTGDASGSMDDDNGIGFSIYWTLTSGTDFQGGTSGSWTTHGNNLYGRSGDLNVLGDTATNWFLTGVQLEVGAIATDFEHEDWDTTLRKCQRYYERLNMNQTGSQTFAIAFNQGTTQAASTLDYVRKRAHPTVTFTAAATFEILYNSGGSLVQTDCTAISAAQIGENSTQIQAYIGSGLTLGEASVIRRDGTDTTYVEFSSEL
jgi:hypothetical protein